MADIVSGLVSDVLKTLASIAFQEFKRLRGLKDDVSALKNTYTSIQAVLADAEVKQREQKAVEEWLNRLRSASLEVENVLDDVLTDAMLQRLHNEIEGIKYKVRAFFSCNYNPLMVRIRVANKVKTIRRKLDMIAKDKSEFNFTSNALSADVGVGSETTNMETSSLVPTSVIFGRDAEVETVSKEICRKDIIGHDTEGVRVYAIWGMGGVGKTTLAQLVYNHERVKTHFDLQSWVYVSSEFQVKKITKEIIESINKSPCQLSQLDSMQKELKEKLEGKRFLIVLDDVWIEDREVKKWDELSKALSYGAKGSIVIVTTRNQTTSRMMAEFQHQLGCLSEEDSWSLFKNRAFAPGTRRDGVNIKELESIGKQIVDKCKGLPLAVKTLGGLMWSKSSVSEWQSVKDSDVWEVQENDVMPALKLSYDNLLPHMKRCYAYCCLFPKGFQMRKDILIELWISNRFLAPRGRTDLYMIGEEVCNCLVSRSFLQDVQEYIEMDVQEDIEMDLVCKMHDLMHDLARHVMRHDCSVIESREDLITPDEVLHFSSSCPDFSFSNEEDVKKLTSLRSLFVFVEQYNCNIIREISKHMYLRVLLLDGIRVSTLLESICKLKHLRYLSIPHSEIKSLPESIIYLQNLEVLLLRGCYNLVKLPEGMRYLKKLRCLDNRGCSQLHCMPVGMNELGRLRRLEMFVVGKKKGAQIRELGDFNLLGRRFVLRGLENVGGLEDAKSANLKNNTKLIYLKLSWLENGLPARSVDKRCIIENDEDVVEGLEPNSSLKELEIHHYMGKMIRPSWMVKLGNLVKIEFKDCGRCSSIPSLGKLPSLRFIHISSMNALKCLDDDEFPSLQELQINECDKLVSLPSNLPNLKRLEIGWAEGLVSLPSNLPKLEILRLTVVNSLVSLPSNLRELKTLVINGAMSLVSLPSNFPHLVILNIFHAGGLVSLPNNLPKLSELDIRSCPELHCLPDGLKELTSLKIVNCEKLWRRCEKEKGEDWPKISHVPNLHISEYYSWFDRR